MTATAIHKINPIIDYIEYKQSKQPFFLIAPNKYFIPIKPIIPKIIKIPPMPPVIPKTNYLWLYTTVSQLVYTA